MVEGDCRDLALQTRRHIAPPRKTTAKQLAHCQQPVHVKNINNPGEVFGFRVHKVFRAGQECT